MGVRRAACVGFLNEYGATQRYSLPNRRRQASLGPLRGQPLRGTEVYSLHGLRRVRPCERVKAVEACCKAGSSAERLLVQALAICRWKVFT